MLFFVIVALKNPARFWILIGIFEKSKNKQIKAKKQNKKKQMLVLEIGVFKVIQYNNKCV